MSPPGRRVDLALVLAGTALYATLAVTSLRQKSSTFDELTHVSSGWTHLTLGDYRMSPDHPPLLRKLAALPLLFMDVEMKPGDAAWRMRRPWEFGKRWLYRWNDADELLFWARLPIVGLGALLGVAVYLWSLRRFGRPAAILSLLLCLLSPDVLAHGRLVTTDLGITLFVFGSVVAFDAMARRLTLGRVILAGLAVGAAFSSKYSAPVLLPIFLVLAAVLVVRSEPLQLGSRELAGRGRRAVALALALLLVGLVALACVWASFGFRSDFSPDATTNAAFDWEKLEPEPPAVAALAAGTRRLGLLPDPYLYGFLRVFKHSEARSSFLLGQRSDEGFPHYFLVSFLVKTPVALLVLLIISVVTRGRHGVGWREEAFVWLPVIVYAGLTLTRGLNIGHRHLLPIYPFLFVAAGRAATWAWSSPSRGPKACVALLATWYVGAAAFVHPNYLAYFNELVGGPRNGHKVLVDSSLDWGQDLKPLAGWLRQRGIPSVKLSYFGTGDPEYYRIPGSLLPGYVMPVPAGIVRQVSPGDIVAVSATNLQCVYLDPEDCSLMERLRPMEPMGQVGHSILVYRADFAWP